MKNIREKTVFIDEDNELEYKFRPVEDTLKIVKTDTGFEARYLVQDDNPESPDSMNGGEDCLFLVNFHRAFDIRKDNIITMEQVRKYYLNPGGKGGDNMPEGYHFFKMSMLSHSGVWLALDNSLDQYYMGLDTSHVGLVCVSKVEWPEEPKARGVAEDLVEQWNQYLRGDVYGIIKETYDEDKEQVDIDSVWGFYGFEYAKKALETEI